jgi:HD-GYP domain-containing protein (c-di-GMP phosphodiesterase class II)
VEEAMKEIRDGSGKGSDPQLVELFKKILPDILKIKEKFDKSESNSW